MGKHRSGGRACDGASSASPRTGFKMSQLVMAFIVAVVLCGATVLTVPAGRRMPYVIAYLVALLAGLALRFLHGRFPGKIPYAALFARSLTWYETLERHQKLYFNIVLMIPLLTYAYLVDAVGMYRPLVLLVFVYSLGIAAYDVLRIYKRLSESLLGKGLLAVGLTIGSNLALGMAWWIIGEMTRVAPSNFPHTMSFMTIVSIPFLFVLLGVVYVPVAMAAAPLLLTMSTMAARAPQLARWLFAGDVSAPGSRYVFATLGFQLFFYAVLMMVVPRLFVSTVTAHSQAIESAIGTSIFIFDMYPGTECDATAGSRVAALGDERFLIASKIQDKVTFGKPRKCVLEDTSSS